MMKSGCSTFPSTRLRRLRQHSGLRRMLEETHLSPQDLVYPLFIHHGKSIKNPINSMPEQYQISIDYLPAEIREVEALGIPAVLLFAIPATKDAVGSSADEANSLIEQAVKAIKATSTNILVITDLCFCEYTDHGHCGVLGEETGQLDVHNDKTLVRLVDQAISHATAAADVIAPSGMMDGMVASIREGLDKAGYSHLPILSYAVKYASSLYGPFREAAQGVPSFGNRKTYQMNPANASEALREAALDVQEGADMLMIKPAHAYLDIIYQIKQAHPEVPLGAYHVSGEFAMIKAASEKGWLDETDVALEILTSIKRAGADFVITYFAKKIAKLL